MKAKLLSLGFLFILLASFVSAVQEENYLIKKCESIIGNDFINSLEVSDVEEKGSLNILVGTSYNGVLYNFVYDSSTKCYNEWEPKSSVNVGGNIEEIVVRDADYDAQKEIIVNGAKTKGLSPKNPDKYVSVFAMNADSLLSKWSYDKGDSGCAMSNSVDTADLYGMGEEAILMGTESKKVCAFGDWSKNKRRILWVSQVLDNPVKYIEAGDFNNDGSAEIVVLTKLWSSASVYLLDHNGQVLWRREITGGVRTDESKNIWVDDLDGDGTLEILVGTQDHGVDVLDCNGNLKWNFETTSTKTDIVSKVRTYRYFTSDEARKIVVAAKPYIYLLDSAGNLLWKAPVNTTVFDFDYGDIDNDGRNELVAGATSYIYVYSDDGQLEGSWSYASEIQGLTGVYKKRDMDTVKVAVYDFDGDGVFEIVAAFRWFDDQLAMIVPQGSLRVFELNPDYKPAVVVQTTEPITQATGQTTRATTPTPRETTTTLKKTTTTTLPEEKKKGLCCCLPLLPAAIALIAVLALDFPLAVKK
ncbi:MAG: hypothetical protein FJY77_02730 [Candidatus Altiarchaeales archaeon]|nr:hypothetical protein [Candidatus Altiarchaeales archaeon]